MRERPAILFYCQHTMGMGHLVRSRALAEALADRFRVVLLNGGEMPRDLKLPESLKVVNLPPLALDNGKLVSRDERYTLEQAMQTRTALILDSYRAVRPDILLTELFPFGRKKFEFELLPLLEEARSAGAPSPLIVCSLRDILVSRRERLKYEEHVVTIANRYFNAILVHSDPDFARLEESLPLPAPFFPAVNHTGFVVGQRQVRQPGSSRTGPIVISAGGGLYGYKLLSTSIKAHALLSQAERIPMKLIAGPFLPDSDWDALSSAACEREGIALVRTVPDLYEELCSARASVSQCGYNTALEILQAQVPALVVPFADGGEDEQMNRARRLESREAILLLDQNELTAARLAGEIRRLLKYEPRTLALNFDGARRTAEILADMLNRRRLSEMSRRTKELLEWQV